MAQAGKTRGKNGRKRQATVDQGLRANAHYEAQMRAARRGVVEGAEPVLCPVRLCASEGWAISNGKRTWYHFGRIANCVERVADLPSV